MTCIQLQMFLDGDKSIGAAKKPKKLVFAPHPDQAEIIQAAIDKCKSESGTEYDTKALEYICIYYLGSGPSQVGAPKTAENDEPLPDPAQPNG